MNDRRKELWSTNFIIAQKITQHSYFFPGKYLESFSEKNNKNKNR